MIKICKDCLKEYDAKRSSQVFCGTTCQYSWQRSSKNIQRTCLNSKCSTTFTVSGEKNSKVFCSRSCAASVNNSKAPKRKLEGRCFVCSESISSSLKYCSNHKNSNYYSKYIVTKECSYSECGTLFDTFKVHRRYCSDTCSRKSYRQGGGKELILESHKIESWFSGKWNGGSSTKLSKVVRRYVLERFNFSCTVCGFNEKHPSDGSVVVEIDHIDGDGSNHRPENLTVLCPNHHALTPTYRGRNRGNGRKVYYLRVDTRKVDR